MSRSTRQLPRLDAEACGRADGSLVRAFDLLGKRWTGAIVSSLLAGPLRFSELAQGIPQISDRLLSMRLRELEAGGLVARRVREGAPVRVDYELTPKGRALEPAIASLRQWACEWLRD